MKVITLTQPWATLMMLGLKRIETRSWGMSHRGELGIHAAQGLSPIGGIKGLRNLINQRIFFEALMRIVPNYNRYCDIDTIITHLPFGALLGTVDLATIVPTQRLVHQGFWTISPDTWDLTEQEVAFGNYTAGRFGWLTTNPQPLATPLPMKGKLSLWTYEGAIG